MYRRTLKYLIAGMAAIVAACSTTRVIPEGESRLKENHIKVTNSKSYPAADLEPYLKQKPNTYFIFGWNPFLSVYNWKNGSNSGWDRFVQKIGQEPVIYDPSLVASSKQNIRNQHQRRHEQHSVQQRRAKTRNIGCQAELCFMQTLVN